MWLLLESIFVLYHKFTAWKVSKYGVFSGLYFPLFSVLSPNTGKYGLEKTPYFDTFHAVIIKLTEKSYIARTAFRLKSNNKCRTSWGSILFLIRFKKDAIGPTSLPVHYTSKLKQF